MNKKEQMAVNEKAMHEYEKAYKEFSAEKPDFVRLRSCQAYVYETSNYWILQSYNTLVAVTSKDTGICYDVLRLVYGYTSTSAKHIAKFVHDFKTPDYKWCAPKWTAR